MPVTTASSTQNQNDNLGPTVEPHLVDTYAQGTVVRVIETATSTEYGDNQITEKLKLRLTSGPEAGQEVNVDYQIRASMSGEQPLKVNDRVVVVKSSAAETGTTYYASEVYRLPVIGWIAVAFFFLTVLFTGKRGVMAFVGLGLTIAILGWFIIPQISAGHNPFLISFIGTLLIASSSLFLAHGFNRRTSLAFVSILITLGLSLGVATLAVSAAHLYGTGTEESFYLQFAPTGAINLRGLLLGGIIIGLLGVLDDVATAQAASVEEIHRANPSFGFRELYKRGSSVGREHITSLVNTLVLAYTGAAFPLLLLFTAYTTPLWVTLNSEIIVEEIVRTLVGSITLVLAVPLTTALAAYSYHRRALSETDSKTTPTHHHH